MISNSLKFSSVSNKSKLIIWDLLKSVFIALLLITAAFCLSQEYEQVGLILVWQIFIPLLPLVFFIAPSIWRNVCPFATLNQIPRMLRISKGYKLPSFLSSSAPMISVTLLMAGIVCRKFGLDDAGLGVVYLLFSFLLFAFFGGWLFKGKSGWCGTFCPLSSLQWMYGQSALIGVNNHHCQPCLSCSQHCIDIYKNNAVLSELYSNDKLRIRSRLIFTGLFPGFVLAFFLSPEKFIDDPSLLLSYFIVFPSLSLAILIVLWKLSRLNIGMIKGLYTVSALLTFYGFNSVNLIDGINQLTNSELPLEIAHAVNLGILVLSIIWLLRIYKQEKVFINNKKDEEKAAKLINVVPINADDEVAHASVTVVGRKESIKVSKGAVLLAALEANQVGIQANCRMGGCGADLITIVDGEDHISPVTVTEQVTIASLTQLPSIRLACCVKVFGDITVQLGAVDISKKKNGSATKNKRVDERKHIVVIGAGIAGLTTVETLREHDPSCKITLIGKEPYLPYNRMNIGKLITGNLGLIGLQVKPDQWFFQNNVDLWLSTHVTAINPDKKKVTLAVGKKLSYDRLVLAQGSRAYQPSFGNCHLKGIYSLRSVDDAVAMRNAVQETNCKVAAVIGTGPLGLEVADAISQLGIKVIILERSTGVMQQHLDKAAGLMLAMQLRKRSQSILFNSSLGKAIGKTAVEAIELTNGRKLKCDMLVLATGNQPNIELAKSAGLNCRKGVLVNQQLQTSYPDIYAVGDLAELEDDKHIPGLWSVAMTQGSIAAKNALGDRDTYLAIDEPLQLKLSGIDLFVVGNVRKEGCLSIVLLNKKNLRYRKVNVENGKVIGAVLLGYPEFKSCISIVIKKKLNVSGILSDLRTGNWEVLSYLTGKIKKKNNETATAS